MVGPAVVAGSNLTYLLGNTWTACLRQVWVTSRLSWSPGVVIDLPNLSGTDPTCTNRW